MDKVTPSALDIEEVVIGAMLLEKDACDIAFSLLNSNSFFNERFKIIFNAIKKIHDKKEPVDILSVTQYLRASKELQTIGGAYEITKLTNRVGSTLNVENHCRILKQFEIKRSIIDIGNEAVSSGYDSFVDCFDAIDNIKKSIKDIEANIKSNTLTSTDVIIQSVIDKALEVKQNDGTIGYSSGLTKLDIATGGITTGLKYVIAALPSVGKSALARTICCNLARKGISGVFFSMEMPKEQLVRSCIADILNINTYSIKKGLFNKEEESRIQELKESLFSYNFLIDDRPGLDPSDIRATLKKLKESHDIKWFVIDYLGLMKLRGPETRGKNEEAIISIITAENKVMAKEFDLACFELAQLSKEAHRTGDYKPRISHLKGSGSIEANADVVMMIYRPEHHGIPTFEDGTPSQGLSDVIISKNRDGEIGQFRTKFQGQYNRFSDYRQMEIEEKTNDDFIF